MGRAPEPSGGVPSRRGRGAGEPARPRQAARSREETAADPYRQVLEQLRHLYIEEGLSTYEIGRHVGLNRQRVNRLLQAAGVPIGPRGSGRRRSRIPTDPRLPAMLHRLYVEQRLSTDEIGEKLGLSGRAVRYRLMVLGIERRTRGAFDRMDRSTVATEQLERLYVRLGLTADQVADELGASRRTVLLTAHDQNLPVRPGGVPTAKGDLDVRTIEVLYADPAIKNVLRRFCVPVVPTPGAIWERFPAPVPLTPELVRSLYEDCGLAHRHIELLTGNPALSVARRMREWQIPSRPRGGLSPFLKKWRAEQRARRP